jgi:hypothetical protein
VGRAISAIGSVLCAALRDLEARWITHLIHPPGILSRGMQKKSKTPSTLSVTVKVSFGSRELDSQGGLGCAGAAGVPGRA